LVRYLYCEAKCTTGGNVTNLVTEAHDKVSNSVLANLGKVIEVLQERNDEKTNQWIPAIQKLVFFLRKKMPEDVNYNEPERCNMVSYICSKTPVRGSRKAWLPTDRPHEAYEGQKRLETVEIHLPGIDILIQKVYGKSDNAEAELSLEYAIED
jgi:hypothetical protein